MPGLLLGAVLLLSAASVSAHATPLQYDPPASAVLQTAPASVHIKFSEHVEPSASTIIVYGPGGSEVQSGPATVDASSGYGLTVPMHADGSGTYTVSWSVISADDGHFTKGAFVFSVGAQTGLLPESSTSFQIEHETDIPQAITIWIELIGQAMLLGLFALHQLCWRRRLSADADDPLRRSYARRFLIFGVVGVLLIAIGSVCHLLLESQTYASDESMTFAQAISIFIGTTAGFYDAVRLIIDAVFVVLFFVFLKSVLRATRFTGIEGLLWLLLIIEAWIRTRVSHAAAADFHPFLSIVINWIHLLSKDLWIGALTVLVCIFLPLLYRRKDAKDFAMTLTGVSALLSVMLITGGISGLYVIWLHLQNPANLAVTAWGTAFYGLSAFTVLLIVFRLIAQLHIDRAFFDETQSKAGYRTLTHNAVWYAFTFEMFVGLGVLFLSSLLIITTPPLPREHEYGQSAMSQGLRLTFSEYPSEQNQFLVTATGTGQTNSISDMIVTLTNTDRGIGPVDVPLSQQFDGGYVFPKSALSPQGHWTVSVTARRPNAYDANARFAINNPSDIAAAHASDGKRTFGWFELSLSIIALLLLIAGWILYRFSRSLHVRSVHAASRVLPMRRVLTSESLTMSVVYCVGLIFLGGAVAGYHGNFESACIANGGAWHESSPERDGQITSSVTQMGCMLGMGLGQYFFIDERAFDWFTRPASALAHFSMDPAQLVAGKPATLLFHILDRDGNPITDLTREHDRIAHIVVTSADHTIYAHIHAEDSGPLTQSMLTNALFPVHYTFPKAGTYLVGIDFTERSQTFAQHFIVHVAGSPSIGTFTPDLSLTKNFDGYDVTLDPVYGDLHANTIERLDYTITKDGKPVTTLQPYLSAPMHIAVIKDDLTQYQHTHPILPQSFLDSIFNPVDPLLNPHIFLPDQFGPTMQAYVVFPVPGVYVVDGQFLDHGDLVLTQFDVNVEPKANQ